MVPNRQKPGRRALLDGNFARRKHRLLPHEYCIWDGELAGFGMRVRPSGRTYWFVRLRHRGKHRRVSLGRTDEVDAVLARTPARRLLAEVALDGLPKRAVVKATFLGGFCRHRQFISLSSAFHRFLVLTPEHRSG